MIQIYLPENTNYDANGDMVLLPESCTIKATLNGEWSLEITHPLDAEGRWKWIEEESVLKVDSFLQGKQLFRISKPVMSDSGISATAYPIFFDAAKDCFLMDVRPTKANGQEALSSMCAANAKYAAISDIATKNTAYYVRRNLLNAISGDDENSFLNRWGGEIIYNNYTIQINQRAGSDNGYQVLYGKNLAGLSKTVDMTDVVTRIIPVAYNGYTLDGDEPWVDSPIINKYPTIYYREVKFDDVKLAADAEEEEECFVTLSDLRAELVNRCEQMYEDGCDKPTVTLEVDMIELSNTEEYENFVDLEKVSLGDDVYCNHKKLGIATKARCIQLTYDCIRKKVDTVVLGDYVPTVFDKTTSIINKVNVAIKEDGSVVAERVKGILDAMETSLKLQSTAAKRVSGRAFLIEDTDPDSTLYGAMEAGTQGLRIAKEKDAEGKWVWDAAITAAGGVLANVITGMIADKSGTNYWDLENGEFYSEGLNTRIENNSAAISAAVSSQEKIVKDIQDDFGGSIEDLNKKVEATMTSDQIKIEIEKELSNGVSKVATSTGVVVDENGLTVDRSDSELATTISHDGMRVKHDGEEVLAATDEGVDAKNLHATTYLIVGQNARFEDYQGDMTACYYIGG